MIDLRKTLLATGFLALAACGGEPAGTTTPALPALDTIEVTAASNGAGSRWDGVVEAVRQAELTAQTAGRVTAVLVDVNTRVAQGQVLLRRRPLPWRRCCRRSSVWPCPPKTSWNSPSVT